MPVIQNDDVIEAVAAQSSDAPLQLRYFVDDLGAPTLEAAGAVAEEEAA